MIHVFYHMMTLNTPCPDGIFSAAIAKRFFQDDANYVGCCYVPLLKRPLEADIPQDGDMVYVLDFSFEAWILEEWQKRNIGFKIIDHHERKMLELLGKRSLSDAIVFNNFKCGAILTWEFFFPTVPVPAILKYVDDRDRWQHKLPYTAEIHAAVGAIGRSFEFCDVLMNLSEIQLIAILENLGRREVEAKSKKVEELARSFQIVEIAGYKIPAVELSSSDAWMRSDICAYLYKKFPESQFAAVRYEDGGKFKWGLASDRNGSNFDVQSIAKSFGGDGHRNSSGFEESFINSLAIFGM